MKCPNPTCGVEIQRSNAKFCSKCRQKLSRKVDLITCNGEDEDGKRCAEKILSDEQFCANCSREVDPEEFWIANCQKCGEYCLASNKMCMQCLQTETSESRTDQLNASVTEPFQKPTGSTVTCEHCGNSQSGHWSFCINCGKNHPFKPNDQGASGGTEDQTTTLPTNNYLNYEMGSDEVEEDILITMAEAVVIQAILDNDQSRKTNTPAIQNVSENSQSTSAKAATIQKIIDPRTQEKVNAIQKILGLGRPSESEVAVHQKVTEQAKFGTIQKGTGQTNATATQKVPDQAVIAAVQKLAGQTNATTIQKVPDQAEIAAVQTLACQTNATAIQKVPDQTEIAAVQTLACQTIATAIQKVPDQAEIASVQTLAGQTNATAIQKVPDHSEISAFKKLAGLANTDAIHKILDPAEAEDFQKVLDQCGYSELMKALENSNNTWRDMTIRIAITGATGSGKSSLINALCGRMDDDPDAAHTDVIECTKKPTPYPHPLIKNLVLWDLPAVGTPNFPKETYIEDARFDEYDFIILVSCSRYTNNDTWLAKQIKSHFPDANLIFVRTKIDNDLECKRKFRRIPLTEDEIKKVFNAIKQDCYKNLKDANIKNPHVFMVDNHDHSKFEFGNLFDMLVDKLSVLKKDALVNTIHSFTQNIVPAKYELFTKRLGNISKQAAVAAVKSNRACGERLEIYILKEEMMLYKQQFGIDVHSLDIVAQRFGLDIEEVYMKMDSETHVILRKFEQYYIENDFVARQYDSLPWYKKVLYTQLRMYQEQCLSLLRSLLKQCVKENKNLQKNIAVWSLIPK